MTSLRRRLAWVLRPADKQRDTRKQPPGPPPPPTSGAERVAAVAEWRRRHHQIDPAFAQVIASQLALAKIANRHQDPAGVARSLDIVGLMLRNAVDDDAAAAIAASMDLGDTVTRTVEPGRTTLSLHRVDQPPPAGPVT